MKIAPQAAETERSVSSRNPTGDDAKKSGHSTGESNHKVGVTREQIGRAGLEVRILQNEPNFPQ
jgi:hypothetical protein